MCSVSASSSEHGVAQPYEPGGGSASWYPGTTLPPLQRFGRKSMHAVQAASGEDGAAGAGAGTAKAPFGGDAFAGIAQAAFAVAGGDPAEGVPRRRGFLGRPGGGGLAGPGMAGLQSFSAARSRPSSSSAVKWGRHGGTSPGGLAATALQAMARATVSQPLSEIQEGEDADPFLGMPPQFMPPAMPMDPSGAKGDGGRGSVWGL